MVYDVQKYKDNIVQKYKDNDVQKYKDNESLMMSKSIRNKDDDVQNNKINMSKK